MIDGYVTYFARELRRAAPTDLELDDLISIGTIGLMESPHAPGHGESSGAWARQKIRDAMIEALQASAWWPSRSSTDGDQLESPVDLEATVTDRIVADRIANAISSLPDDVAKALTLYYYEERSLTDIGATLGIRPSRAAQLRDEGLDQLRRRLALDRGSSWSGSRAGSA